MGYIGIILGYYIYMGRLYGPKPVLPKPGLSWFLWRNHPHWPMISGYAQWNGLPPWFLFSGGAPYGED
jgi:hypothetical protein